MYNIIPHKNAQAKIKAHVGFLGNVSEFAAERLYDEYSKNLDIISENPHGCPRYENKKNHDLKYKLFHKGRYKIVFEIISNDVYIYDIQDCRQNTNKNLI